MKAIYFNIAKQSNVACSVRIVLIWTLSVAYSEFLRGGEVLPEKGVRFSHLKFKCCCSFVVATERDSWIWIYLFRSQWTFQRGTRAQGRLWYATRHCAVLRNLINMTPTVTYFVNVKFLCYCVLSHSELFLKFWCCDCNCYMLLRCKFVLKYVNVVCRQVR